MKITTITKRASHIGAGNWFGPRDIFPGFEIDQETGAVVVLVRECADWKRARGCTDVCRTELSADGATLLVRGSTRLKNYKHPKCSGVANFCFVLFEGDSGHIYTHRAMASKGWMTCRPSDAVERLVKLGVGISSLKGIVQQGDFVLRPARGSALPVEDFRHEYMGSGHHRFCEPVLRAYNGGRTHVLITTPVRLVHEAVDGIQHPDVEVPPGQYIVGTTSPGLAHANRRD